MGLNNIPKGDIISASIQDHLADDRKRGAGSGDKGDRNSPKVTGEVNTTFRWVACALTLEWEN